MHYKAVLFDMDGTVLDTLDDLTDSINHCLHEYGICEVSRDYVRQSLGNGASYLVDRCAPSDLDQDLKGKLLVDYRLWYDAHCRIKTCPYPGILDLMHSLKDSGVKLVIISNKPDSAVQELSAHFFGELLEFSVGESERVRRKPYPDTVLAAAERMGLAPESCVYIGDTEVDLETAKNAGMDCIAVTWGFRNEPQLLFSGAETIAHSVSELRDLLN